MSEIDIKHPFNLGFLRMFLDNTDLSDDTIVGIKVTEDMTRRVKSLSVDEKIDDGEMIVSLELEELN